MWLLIVVAMVLGFTGMKAQSSVEAYYKNEVGIGIGAPTFVRYGDEACLIVLQKPVMALL